MPAPRITATAPSVPSVYVATRRCSECEARGRTCAPSQNRSVLVACRTRLARSDLDRTPARPRIGQSLGPARGPTPRARMAARTRGVPMGTACDSPPARLWSSGLGNCSGSHSQGVYQAPRPLQAPCPGHARGESGGPGPSSGFRQSEARYKCAQPVLAIVRRAGERGGGGEHVHLPGRALGMGAGGDVGDRRRLGLV